MDLDIQFLFNVAVGAVLAVAGWFFRQLWDAVKELRKDLHDIEKELPISYVRRDEFTEIMRDIKDMFNKINDKLDNKVDK